MHFLMMYLHNSTVNGRKPFLWGGWGRKRAASGWRWRVDDWMEVVFEWQMLRALSFSNACFHVIFVVQREIMAPCCLTATRVREGGGGGPLPCKSSWRGDNMPRLSGWLTGRLASNSQLAVGKGGGTFVGGWVSDGEVATDLRLVLSSAMRLLGRFQRMKLPPPLFPLPPLSFFLFLNSLLEIISSCSDLISMKLLLIAFFLPKQWPLSLLHHLFLFLLDYQLTNGYASQPILVFKRKKLLDRVSGWQDSTLRPSLPFGLMRSCM